MHFRANGRFRVYVLGVVCTSLYEYVLTLRRSHTARLISRLREIGGKCRCATHNGEQLLAIISRC